MIELKTPAEVERMRHAGRITATALAAVRDAAAVDVRLDELDEIAAEVIAAAGWTLRTADGTRAAHIEHTVAITENGPDVLTRLA